MEKSLKKRSPGQKKKEDLEEIHKEGTPLNLRCVTQEQQILLCTLQPIQEIAGNIK